MGVEARAPNPELYDDNISKYPEKFALGKLSLWSTLIEKGCLAKRGRGGQFCAWGGHPCYYNGCPRRIFEELAVAGNEDMREQFAKMQEQLNEANARIKELQKEIKELQKES